MEAKEEKSYIVGITGGICSGKSTVLKTFEELGERVFSCDEKIKEIKKSNKKVQTELKKSFPELYEDSKKLAELVFSDFEKKKLLENILLPELEKEINAFIDENKGHIMFIEAPLLYERKKENNYDLIISTICSEITQKERCVKRGISIVLLEKILSAQLSMGEKANRADYVINSDKGYNDMRKEVMFIYEKIKRGK